jgi:hypothetical protein
VSGGSADSEKFDSSFGSQNADTAQVPDDYHVEVVVRGLEYPTNVDFDEASGRLMRLR